LGGIPGLANQFSREQIMNYVYQDCPTVENPDQTRPLEKYVDPQGRTASLPAFRNVVRSLDQVVRVDYVIPGCPPTPDLLKAALEAILTGKLPPPGTVLAPDVALCETCPRKATKPTDIAYAAFRRPHLTMMDPDRCLLAQGVVCMGPATRGGCGARCIEGHMPCTGCFGPTSRVHDQGAKMLSSLSAAVASDQSDAIDAILAGIPDPVGTFYRYGLPHCLLRAQAAVMQPTGKEPS
jgi:F420-non-reducing hydrogenase small subunit